MEHDTKRSASAPSIRVTRSMTSSSRIVVPPTQVPSSKRNATKEKQTDVSQPLKRTKSDHVVQTSIIEANQIARVDLSGTESTAKSTGLPTYKGHDSPKSPTVATDNTERSSLEVDHLQLDVTATEDKIAPSVATLGAQASDAADASSSSISAAASTAREDPDAPKLLAATPLSGPSLGLEDKVPRLEGNEPDTSLDTQNRLSLRNDPNWSTDQIIEDTISRFPIQIPEGHKLVHIMRHCRAWNK
jgi:hypothetical protein